MVAELICSHGIKIALFSVYCVKYHLSVLRCTCDVLDSARCAWMNIVLDDSF